ncbi:MAG TPA: Fur family transcriptional regulator [Anaerolineales bacterium]|nr:Fur family transcriptional regulator [Anaerolineales bacterium]
METTHTEKMIAALQQGGFRITPQRIAICRLLAETDEHPTAQSIHMQLSEVYPSLSLATVYNTLETLVDLGAVNSLGSVGDDAVHYDADTSPHVNLACVACHQVIDLPSQHVKGLDEEVAQRSGYELQGARVLYYGLCPTCQAQRRA